MTIRDKGDKVTVLGGIYDEIEAAIKDIQDVLESITKLEKELSKDNLKIYELINQSYERSTDSVKRLNRLGKHSPKRGRLRASRPTRLRKKGKTGS